MSVQSLNRRRRWLAAAVMLLALAGVFVARTALARVVTNTIDPVDVVAADGRHVTVTGPITFDAGEQTHLRVTVTQRSTGAVAEGRTFLIGTSTLQQWAVEAEAEGNEIFAAGPATAVAVARTTVRGQATDAHQWLVNITLISE